MGKFLAKDLLSTAKDETSILLLLSGGGGGGLVWGGGGCFQKKSSSPLSPSYPFVRRNFEKRLFGDLSSLLGRRPPPPPKLEMSENWPLTRREEREKGQNDLFWQKKEGLTGNRLLAIKLLLEKRGKCLPFDISGERRQGGLEGQGGE